MTRRLLPALVLVASAPAAASVLEPPSTGGVLGLHRALSRIDVHRRVLVIGAHPDDEDTSLLALVSRGMGGEAAYLSLSRGEGGQNLIGTELGPDLGLLRSQELLSARSVDGARQFFTRAFDFGYTRSIEETLERWPEEILLEDTVRVIRRFKPQVVVSIFPDSARAGHGQHQAAGRIARRAFDAAADPEVFPEMIEQGLPPWRPSLFYRSAFFRPVPGNLELATGGTDPASGKTYFQLAMASRSMHRSQDMGVLQDTGPRVTRVVPETEEGAAATSASAVDLFAGVPTGLSAIADLLAEGSLRDEVATVLAGVEDRVAAVREGLAPAALDRAVAPLATILAGLHAAVAAIDAAGDVGAGGVAARQLLDEKVAVAERAWSIASGFVVDATTDDDRLLPGGSTEARLVFYNSGARPVEVAPSLRVPAGWREPAAPESRSVAPGESASWTVTVELPVDAAPSVPYFRARPRDGDVYDWTGVPPEVRGEPFGPPPLVAELAV
ncbi:MAG: PIG-L family deacetylase, partial [Thermoanaerobaculia bacterium]|nr:PIG-L family deacetylase [Thermoanaerobaculia bacterium]